VIAALRRMLGRMAGDEASAASNRAKMVAQQLRARGIRDERVLEAMATVPREHFLADPQRPWAYADEALPIDCRQTISQPYIVARMTELASPKPGDRVLEVGTGSGYQAAILATLGATVLSLERHPDLASTASGRLAQLGLGSRVEVRVGDGSLGAADRAPFDAILVTAAAPAIPDALREQLADGGRLVIPVGPRSEQQLLLVQRSGDEWREYPDGPVVFVPLIGEAGFGGGPETSGGR
jgi:protein-L-isoaspartate(D-aspartate) O-methyltransferase